MSVRRDKRTGKLFFRTVVKLPGGQKVRLFGTPEAPGPYQRFKQNLAGARAAEQFAIAEAMNGPKVAAATVAVTPSAVAPVKAQEVHTPIKDHAETFLTKYKPSQKGSERREKRRVLKTHILPFFGEMFIAELKQTDIDTYAARELARGMKIKTVNNQLAVLSTLIRYTTGEKSRLRFKLDGPTAEIHAVDLADVEKLLAAALCDLERVVVLLAAEAGLRAGEIRGLQWTDVKDGKLTVRRALDKQTNEAGAPKHNKTRTVPLSPRLAATLAALPKRGIWIVAGDDGSFVTYDLLSDSVNKLYARAEVPRPPKPLHCLRHTFGTVMAKKVKLPVLRDLMGHADIQTTLRYIDVSEDDKRDAIAAVFGGSVAANGSKPTLPDRQEQ